MSFAHLQARTKQESLANWPTRLGFADERDGRSLDQLARVVHMVTRGWPTVVAARLLLVTLLGTLPNAPVAWLTLFFCLAADGATGSLTWWMRDKTRPNRQFAAILPLAAATGATFGYFSGWVATDPIAQIAIVLAPCMVVTALCGSRRLISIIHLAGALVGMACFGGAGIATLALSTGIVAILAQMAISARVGALKGQQPDHGYLSGDQARALLMEFEAAGRGWFWETDRNGSITYVSETLARQFGHSTAELVGTSFTALVGSTGTGNLADEQRSLGFHFSARTGFSEVSVAAESADGERWWSISGQPVMTPFGQFLGFRGSGSDLTEMRRSEAEIRRLAQFDSLTGLANRVQMMTTLEQTLHPQRGMGGASALLILDLDRFKEVNDTMGHPAGDALLRQVAQRLLRIIGNNGKVGRLGGDEFQIIMPGMTDRAALAELGARIIRDLSQPYMIDGSQVIIGVSIGIALAPEDGNSAEKLIRNADLALYAAKGDGRGAFHFYAPAMHADAEDRRQLEHDLRHAIVTGGLHLEYQPVVSASTERISGFEALIRWEHPTRGRISPAVFIAIAEDAGLIDPIGEWVLRTACAEAALWPDGIRIAVNVSPIQFANANLPATVLSALANAGLSASRLELELTESVFLADQADTDSKFTALKAIGVRLALDDFGTGYSALGYLKTAPFDKIKIDQSFVRGAAIKGSRNAAIVKSIVNLAEALNMETTAEGAETMDELALIRSLGCSHVQGYIYGRPERGEAARALLAAGDGHIRAQGHKASREPRMAMLRSVMLLHGKNRYACRIRNISPGGAMIEGILEVPAGTEFVIELAKDYLVKGVCRWSQDDRMGVEFAERIVLERLRAQTAEREPLPPSDIPDFYRETPRRVAAQQGGQ